MAPPRPCPAHPLILRAAGPICADSGAGRGPPCRLSPPLLWPSRKAFGRRLRGEPPVSKLLAGSHPEEWGRGVPVKEHPALSSAHLGKKSKTFFFLKKERQVANWELGHIVIKVGGFSYSVNLEGQVCIHSSLRISPEGDGEPASGLQLFPFLLALSVSPLPTSPPLLPAALQGAWHTGLQTPRPPPDTCS